MIDIQRILCPVDFSDFSRRALDHAVAIARWYEATVRLLNVCSTVPMVAYAPGTLPVPPLVLSEDDREDVRTLMKEFAEGETGTAMPLEFEVRDGNVAQEVLAAARAMPADLIVLGTHGRAGFERLMLGSVTEKVLRKATCPVLTVPRNTPEAVPAAPVLYRRILCAVDFSPCSVHALEYALSLAQEADAQLTVAHVIEVPPHVPPTSRETALGPPRTLREYITTAEEDRRPRLDQLIPDDVRAYCSVETILSAGRPDRELLRLAAQQHSELIVMGVHGRTAADLFFFGSTAQHVVREAACPVLTLRHE